ncbi:MAG TPA: hemerythrin domain-containing protein [Caulobacteraceae bacterium]
MSYATLLEIENIPQDLMKDPLDWFFAEHYRQRQFYRLVGELATVTAFDGDRVTRLLDFLRHDLALHVIDEEEDLFPLLRRRALPEDEVEQVLDLLSTEHRSDMTQAQTLRGHLEACLLERKAPGLEPRARKVMQNFAAQALRHLALENAVVLPIARLRLSAEDLLALGRRLAARRGVVLEVSA